MLVFQGRESFSSLLIVSRTVFLWLYSALSRSRSFHIFPSLLEQFAIVIKTLLPAYCQCKRDKCNIKKNLIHISISLFIFRLREQLVVLWKAAVPSLRSHIIAFLNKVAKDTHTKEVRPIYTCI